MINRIFYTIKPIVPRSLQIAIRRQVVAYKLKKYSHVWPIDEKAGNQPPNWQGWPENKKFALVLSHDVDTQRGHDNCHSLMELEKRIGFVSSFNFVPERYKVSTKLRNEIEKNGFGLNVHGLKHDGKLFASKKMFDKRAIRINRYLKEWNTRGFASPSAHHNLDWMHQLNIEYDTSTFDTDPFEPQPDGVGTIFPFPVFKNENNNSTSQSPGLRASQPPRLPGSSPPNFFFEFPYTLPQDFTLFILMKEQNIDIWKKKLRWIADKGGMALLNVHPDYIKFNENDTHRYSYPARYYEDFLIYIKEEFSGQYWNVLPKDLSQYYRANFNRLNPYQKEKDTSRANKQKSEQSVSIQESKVHAAANIYSGQEINGIDRFSKRHEICLIDPETDPRWDRFVADHPFGWICHLSGWKKILEKNFSHMKGYYIVKFKNGTGQFKAALPLYHVRSWLTGKRLVSIPFATLSDPMISSKKDMEDLLDYALELSDKLKNPFFELRSHLSSSFVQCEQLIQNKAYKSHYLSLDNGIDEIWKSFHKMVKRNINKAKKSDLKFKETTDEKDILQFYNLYCMTRKYNGLPPQPYRFVEDICNYLNETNMGNLFKVEYGDKMIAGGIFFKFNKRFSNEFDAWDKKYKELRPNYHLYWEAIKYAHQNRYSIFDFGRTYEKNQGLMNFKKRWGTTVVDLPIFYLDNGNNDHKEKETKISYKVIRSICTKAPLTVNKALGEFLYSHLG